jgi:hypothetical protein
MEAESENRRSKGISGTSGTLAQEVASGYVFLRTPSGQESGVDVERLVTKEGEPARIGERAYDKATGRLAQIGLPQQIAIAMLPTPQGIDWKGESGRSLRGEENDLPHQIKNLLPTPNRFDYNVPETKIAYEKRKAHQAKRGVNLHLPLKTLVFQALNPPETIGTSRGLKLQPIFCEWMMGYPAGWTNISKE